MSTGPEASPPAGTIREMICSSIDVIIQTQRLRDGTRRITHITEVLGMEGDVPTTQDLLVYEISGEDSTGKLIGVHRGTGIGHPRFWPRAQYFGETERLAAALDTAGTASPPIPQNPPRTPTTLSLCVFLFPLSPLTPCHPLS